MNDYDEEQRLYDMLSYERQYSNYEYICGIDEAGRGPFAGPVVAAAVVLPKDTTIRDLNDSKKLSEKKRNILFDEIMSVAASVGVGIVSEKVIDDINILQATYEAMRQAVSKLSVQPDILLNDAVIIPDISIEQVSIIKGDAKSLSIAAASVIAKVTRDRIMIDYAKRYPEYAFDKHKGYGTALHRQRIVEYGICPIHRKSFLINLSKKYPHIFK